MCVQQKSFFKGQTNITFDKKNYAHIEMNTNLGPIEQQGCLFWRNLIYQILVELDLNDLSKRERPGCLNGPEFLFPTF